MLACMRLVIALIENQPPAGTVTADDRLTVAFAGWLGLINVLSGLVDPAADGIPAHARVDASAQTDDAGPTA